VDFHCHAVEGRLTRRGSVVNTVSAGANDGAESGENLSDELVFLVLIALAEILATRAGRGWSCGPRRGRREKKTKTLRSENVPSRFSDAAWSLSILHVELVDLLLRIRVSWSELALLCVWSVECWTSKKADVEREMAGTVQTASGTWRSHCPRMWGRSAIDQQLGVADALAGELDLTSHKHCLEKSAF
jgi:hypothetical protein